MSSKEIAIRVTGLSKKYEIYSRPGDRLKQFVLPKLRKLFGMKQKDYCTHFSALSNLSFELQKGKTLGIVGRNGSGKSTLLQIICGTLSPSEGGVEVQGRIAALLELGSGFNPEFTGRENLFLNASILGLSAEEINERSEKIIDFADIGDFIDQPIKNYSSGMVMRLAFAVIAHVDADILVIDEALSVGDVFFNQKCMRFLRNFMHSGTVLFVSHDTNAILNMCSEAIYLEGGKISNIGNPKKVVKQFLKTIYCEGQILDEIPNISEDSFQNDEYELVDIRQSLFNSSNLRNNLEIFTFK